MWRPARASKVAFYFEGEPEGDRAPITYQALLDEVVRVANGLKALGVKKGTPVGIYMGMGPGLPVAMLACARLGAPHTVVFGGFSADSLAGRLNDMKCEVLITQDEGWRRGQTVPLKANVDEALESCPTVKTVVVGQRTMADVPMVEGRDITWRELTDGQSADPATCPCEPMDAEDLLYLLYTSGTTAKPKGIVHTTGGYLVGVATTHHYIFDLKAEQDVYWCAADIGWVTGHSYIVYGPLCNGATSVLYEGTPDFPDRDRWWDIVERYGVTILYTAPTAIRAHMKWGPEHAQKHDLSSLRLLGSVGEPINPEAWMWYHEHIGGGRCPIVDTWWQTETGMIMITPLPGITTTKPGSATQAVPRRRRGRLRRRRKRGRARAAAATSSCGGRGRRCCAGSTATTSGTSRRTGAAIPGVYFAGDGARIDEDGDFWLLGRVDDVMNVSGPPDLHDRGGVGARRSSRGRRGGRVRPHGSAHRPGHRRLRDAQGRRRGLGGDARRAARPRLEGDRADREARQHPLHAGAAEDALGEDHAAAVARRGREPAARRHDDARRSRSLRRDSRARGSRRP